MDSTVHSHLRPEAQMVSFITIHKKLKKMTCTLQDEKNHNVIQVSRDLFFWMVIFAAVTF